MASKFFKIDNEEQWQALLNKTLFRTFFHSLGWEKFLEGQFSWLKFEHYNWQNKALLSLARVGKKLISHPFCEYGGFLPLVGKIDGQEFKEDLFTAFKEPLRISFHPQLLNFLQNEPGAILESSSRVSYWVAENLDLRKTTRHEIEKAETRGIEIEQCRSREELKNFYDLHVKSAKKHRVPAYPFSFFEYFMDSSDARIILAKKDGQAIAGSVFLSYDKFVHYFQNAVNEKYKDFGANYLILREEINQTLAQNKIFDFGGTRVGSSLEVFKKGWGGTEHPILELRNHKGGSSLRQSKLRNVFSLLPSFLIKKVSPHLLRYKL
jgi:hypothetical protein